MFSVRDADSNLDVDGQEIASKWKGLLVAALKKVSAVLLRETTKQLCVRLGVPARALAVTALLAPHGPAARSLGLNGRGAKNGQVQCTASSRGAQPCLAPCPVRAAGCTRGVNGALHHA